MELLALGAQGSAGVVYKSQNIKGKEVAGFSHC